MTRVRFIVQLPVKIVQLLNTGLWYVLPAQRSSRVGTMVRRTLSVLHAIDSSVLDQHRVVRVGSRTVRSILHVMCQQSTQRLHLQVPILTVVRSAGRILRLIGPITPMLQTLATPIFITGGARVVSMKHVLTYNPSIKYILFKIYFIDTFVFLFIN